MKVGFPDGSKFDDKHFQSQDIINKVVFPLLFIMNSAASATRFIIQTSFYPSRLATCIVQESPSFQN